jgi:hypothetical protein
LKTQGLLYTRGLTFIKPSLCSTDFIFMLCEVLRADLGGRAV